MKNIISILFIIIFPTALLSQNEKYPIPPKTQNLLFYIQRNHNSNTIIYDSKYDKQGNLDKDEPIIVYWRRYDEQGQKMELRNIEKWYAYGVDWKKIEYKKMYFIKLVADKKHEFWLKQLAPYKSVIITIINNELSVLDHIYIFADNSGMWPKVKYIELFGESTKTKEKTYEKLIVD
jgi:hypothetical protein